ncbi:MAG: carbohydrate-binding domain-containing protein, partial [Porphyromonadaceae bacterium]|nr:carbohydrate-binding domain-containing protein [Porphyromonadaceae bacterium]
DEDLYWEANSFTTSVTVTYDDTTATVESDNSKVLSYIEGSHVTIDMQTNSVKNVELIVQGKSDDGSLKIYGEKKFKLTLAGVELTSSCGPAINDQCHKRAFVHLAEGTTNYLTDASTYSDDFYYLDGATSADEDRKGCFFSEGNLIFSGTGVLVLKGRYKHALVTDGYFYMRPGVTLVVEDAAKNAIHVKGDEDDGIGVQINGGLIYANVSSTAGKCIKTDLDIVVNGGKLLLNTSGGSEYDADEQDTSSASCLKSDGNIFVTGGELTLKSTGTGGKGISSDGSLQIDDGTITITTSGGKYTYSSSLTSSPKGVKADGNVTINGGQLNISVTGKSDGSEGLESKADMVINGGEIYVYAYDDAINASNSITITGGKVYAYAVNNDGIDSNGTLSITGGLVIASGCSAPEAGFDCDFSTNFTVSGGIIIGTGGDTTSPSSSSTQRSVVYKGLSATKGVMLCIQDSDGTPILTYELPRTMSSMTLLFSSPEITSGSTYTVSKGGTLSDETDSWNGWYEGGSWSNGTQLGTFTANSVVTMVTGSTSGGMNGGPSRR